MLIFNFFIYIIYYYFWVGEGDGGIKFEYWIDILVQIFR